MSGYQPQIDDMMFTLSHVAGLDEVAKLDGHQDVDPDTVRAILEEAGRFFAEVMAPLNRIGDQQGSVLTEDGTVRTPDGFKEAYRKYIESGWGSGPHARAVGGRRDALCRWSRHRGDVQNSQYGVLAGPDAHPRGGRGTGATWSDEMKARTSRRW